jgi:hypothetical protein
MTEELKTALEQEQRRRIETLYWAGVLIWAGLVFLADHQDWLPTVGEAGPWSWVFFGAGLYGTLGNFFRLVSVDWVNPTSWDWIWSGFWLIIGLVGVTGVDVFWPLALILVGVVVIANMLFRRD